MLTVIREFLITGNIEVNPTSFLLSMDDNAM